MKDHSHLQYFNPVSCILFSNCRDIALLSLLPWEIQTELESQTQTDSEHRIQGSQLGRELQSSQPANCHCSARERKTVQGFTSISNVPLWGISNSHGASKCYIALF